MNGPLVSVVIAVYNDEGRLPDAIRSVLAQDYDPVEIVVVDDGSTDGTAAAARAFAEVTYVHRENGGCGAARNTGVAAASGEFAAFLDADDLYMPHKLSAQMGHLLDHPDTDCVLARQELLLEDGMEPPEWLRPDSVFGDPGGLQPQSMVIRRSTLLSVGSFNPSFRIADGMELLGRLRAAGVKIDVIDRKVAYKRVHGSNLTHQNRAMRNELLKGLKAKIDRERVGRDPRGG